MTQTQQPSTDQEVFELCEREDEDQILAELAGRVSDKYVYEFLSSEGPVTGLSYQGTNWACREFAKHGEVIRIVSKPEIQADPIDAEYVVVSVVAQRFAVNLETGKEIALDSRVGVKRQWIKMEKRDKSIVPNRFFIEQGVSKAQRNAMQALLPTDFVKKVIQQALGQKKNPKAASAPAAKPAAPTQAATQTPAQPAQAPVQAPATPAPTATKPASAVKAAPSAEKAADQVGVIRQKFWATLKKAANTTDDTVARALLKQLSGSEKVSDLPEPLLKSIGNALRGVNSGENELSEGPSGAVVIDKSTGVILYPIQPPVAKVAAEVPPADDDSMF